MTRAEALSALGLEEGATDEDVRLAHRDLAQMLHPDKYEGNKRLRSRAEQQMRAINEARAVLLGSRRAASAPAGPSASPATRAAAAKAARAAVMRQLVQTRERLVKARYLLAAGIIALVAGMRLHGIVGTVVLSFGLTATLWGVQDLVRLGGERGVLRRRLREIDQQIKKGSS